MSALRQDAEAAAGGLITVNKRIDAILLAVDDIYRKIEAATKLLGAEHDEPVENLREHFLALADDQCARGIREAVERLQSSSAEAVELFLRQRAEANRREPWIPVDGGRPGDRDRLPDNKTLVEVELGPDGKPRKAWTQDRPVDPLDRY